MKRFLAVPLLLLVLAGPAGAWGGDGHRIVGEIAWRHLTPRARREVADLLPPGAYATLAEACTWADREGRRHRGLDRYHYMHLSGPAAVLDSATCPDGACVAAGIERFRRVMTRPDASREDRVQALRLVAHLVGDVHQPLHVVPFADGRGGGRTWVRAGTRTRVKFHELWDSVLLEDALQRLYRRGGGRPGGKKDLWRRLAQDLDRTGTVPEAGDRDPLAWAAESRDLAGGPLFRVEDGDTLPETYGVEAARVVESRLRIAGYRLAGLLNHAFDPSR